MSLKTKVDYFQLSSSGFEIESTTENKSVGYIAQAQGADGFVVAVDVGDEIVAPTVDYVLTADGSLSNIKLGEKKTVLGKKVCIGGITINTAAGQPVKMSVSGQQVEDNNTQGCTCTLGSISLDHLFHAQHFGLFDVSNGQLTQSTLTVNASIGTAPVDGVIKASDLVGGSLVITGTIVGVNDEGEISTPTITPFPASGNLGDGVLTQPLSETNPNGDYPQYTFEITYPLKAD